MRANILGAIAILATGCSTDDPDLFEHSYSQGSVAVVGDSLRFTMTGTDPNGQHIETTTLRVGEAPAPVTPVLLDGVALEAPTAQLAAIGDRAYLVWSEIEGGVRYRGAPLAADGTIDSSTILELGARVELRRVGDRYLALELPEPGTVLPALGLLRGTFILPDGRVDGSVDIGTVDSNVLTMTNDASGATGVWGLAYLNIGLLGEDHLFANRVLADGTLPDDSGILVASSVHAEGTAPGEYSIVTTSGGGMLVIYELFRGTAREIHAVQIPLAGPFVDRIVALPGVPQLVPRGDQVLAMNRVGSAGAIESRILDASGSVLSGPVPFASTLDLLEPIATPTGFAVLQTAGEVRMTELAPDGHVVSSTVVASPYEIEVEVN
jgi:hypothetical protein